MYKASQTQEIILKDIKSKKPVYIAPYALAGLGQEYKLNDTETKYNRTDTPTLNAGLDVKYRISDNLTVDLSANTDFAQVEADDQMVNLTRFSLFFPEKRLFFQERKSNFDRQNRLFYSRRIGIFDGQPVGIYGGGRLVGRIGSWDVGLLSMQTSPVEDLFSENFTVARLRRQVINQSTYIGGIITNRVDFKGMYNRAYGLDGIFRLFGDDYLKIMWAQSFENDKRNEPVSLDPARIYFNWERRTGRGLGYNISYSRSGEDYNPGIGYERRNKYSQYSVRLNYGWIPEKSWILSHGFQLDGIQYNRNVDNSMESGELWFGWKFESKSGYTGKITNKIIYDNLIEEFELSEDVSIVPNDYNFFSMKGQLSSPKGGTFVLGSKFEIGQFYDGWRNSISVSPAWLITNSLEVKGMYQYNDVNFQERDKYFDAHIFRLNGLYMLNSKISIAAFIQYNSLIDGVFSNVRLRFNPKEGNDLYIVYNEGYNTDRYRDILMLPLSNERTIMLKYTYTFVL